MAQSKGANSFPCRNQKQKWMYLSGEGRVLETGEKESTLNTKSDQYHVYFLSKYDQFEKIKSKGQVSATVEIVQVGPGNQQWTDSIATEQATQRAYLYVLSRTSTIQSGLYSIQEIEGGDVTE